MVLRQIDDVAAMQAALQGTGVIVTRWDKVSLSSTGWSPGCATRGECVLALLAQADRLAGRAGEWASGQGRLSLPILSPRRSARAEQPGQALPPGAPEAK